MPTIQSPAAKPIVSPRAMRLSIAASAVLVVAGGLAFAYAARQASEARGPGEVVVTIRDRACEPSALSVPAGRTTFRIVNASDRAVEWEILDGVMVAAERENIVPGIAQTLTADLSAGRFEITCGLLNNPRGSLTVTPSAAASAAAANPPTLLAFLGPLAEYRVFLVLEAGRLGKDAEALNAAIAAGDLTRAKALYGEARADHARIAPIARRFADLDAAIEPVATYLAGREADPAFTGFHRIEQALFADERTDGAEPFAARLISDVTELKARLRGLTLTPDEMIDAAEASARSLAETSISTGEERYSRIDLSVFSARIEGIARMMDLLAPVAAKSAPEASAEVAQALAQTRAALADLRGSVGPVPAYDTISTDRRAGLAHSMAALADAIGRLQAAVGLA